MPPAPLANNAVTGSRDQGGAPDTRAPASVTSGHGPRKTQAMLFHHAARLRSIAGLLRQIPKTRASYYDPLFEQPHLVEDDYYRLRQGRMSG
jgi:hypothetical protein